MSGRGCVWALLVLVPAVLAGIARDARAEEAPDGTAVVFLVGGVSFEDLMRIPEVRALAAAGGAGLMSAPTPVRDLLSRADFARAPIRIDDLGSLDESSGGLLSEMSRVGARIRVGVSAVTTSNELVIIATPSPSSQMNRAKDELSGIVMARGSAAALAAAVTRQQLRSPTTLTSDSTRRSGVVTSADVVSTLERFVGHLGSDSPVIRLDPAPAPYELHARYLADRRMTVPVQTGAGIYVTVMGLFGMSLFFRERPAPGWASRAAALGAISLLPLAVSLLLVGHLSSLSYASALPTIVGAEVLATIAIDRVRAAWGATAAAGALGVAVLASLALESALGWTAALTPLLGGSELDGGRFYGLPNVDIGLLVGASLFVAAWIGRPLQGAILVAAVGMFAGLPWTGSNLGGAITLFAAAGLWYGIRRRGGLGLDAIAYGIVTAIVGSGVVLVIHRYLSPFPTHITRFLEGNTGIVSEIGHRLRVGVDLIARNPFALIPLLGVPACWWLVSRPPPRLAEVLAERPVWREAALAILGASVVAYVANDSGAAALGLGFGSAVSALLWASSSDQEVLTRRRPEMMRG